MLLFAYVYREGRCAHALPICYFDISIGYIFVAAMPAVNYQLATVAMESLLVEDLRLLTMDACFTAFDKDG